MSVFYNNALIGASGQAVGGYQIQRSLRFNPADSSFLSRTPASAGNRKTWTWAGWVKRSGLGNFFCLMSAGGNDNFGFSSADKFQFYFDSGVYRLSTQVFRDVSAWYHLVVVYDSPNATAQNRIRVYVNGSEITAWDTNTTVSQNRDSTFNATNQHAIARNISATSQDFPGYLADVHFIDGQALTPTSFGEFDTNNVWQPKAYSGTYGTNGFKLDFSNNSAATAAALGADSSGNGNNFTPNNLTAGPAVVSNSWSGYFDGSGDYLTAPANAAFAMGTGDFTIEFWVYPNQRDAGTQFINLNTSSASGSVIVGLNGSQALEYYNDATRIADSVAFPLGSWTHVALCRSSGTTRLFKNGTQVGSSYSDSINCVSTNPVRIGARHDGAGFVNGYISNLRIVKASAVYTSNFTSPTAPLTAITNTSLLTLKNSTFVDNSTNNFTITAVGNARVDSRSPFEEPVDTDSFVDSPTNYGTDTGAGGEVRGNYATLNPLDKGGSPTISNGNLSQTDPTSGSWKNARGTISVSSDKWYWEMTATSVVSSVLCASVGSPRLPLGFLPGQSSSLGVTYYPDGNIYYQSGGPVAYGSSWTSGDVIGIALDMNSGKVWFSKNGVWQASGDPATGANAAYSNLLTYDTSWGPVSGTYFSGSAQDFNFGQRPFAYTAPSGFKALCTANLPAPTIPKPSTVMDVVTYTGNGASSRNITGTLFQPDLVWIKNRSGTTWHNVIDSVRGASRDLFTNATNAEALNDTTGTVSAFNADGFTVAAGSVDASDVNANGSSYVAWTWDAGSSTVTNTAGSISSQVRSNTSAGFSVITYTGTGANATVGHGLGVAPQMVIVKRRDVAADWAVWHTSIAATNYLLLNSTAASTAGATYWNSTSPASTVFSVGTATNTNANTGTYVAYCFAPVAGYSAFGSYTGNGSTDGPCIHLGFRPAFVIIKCSSASNTLWMGKDYKRAADYNPASGNLYLGGSNTEDTINTVDMDFLANGIKLRGTYSGINESGQTYIYAAWAQHPFALARAR